jgi:hypothetical protein
MVSPVFWLRTVLAAALKKTAEPTRAAILPAPARSGRVQYLVDA